MKSVGGDFFVFVGLRRFDRRVAQLLFQSRKRRLLPYYYDDSTTRLASRCGLVHVSK